MKRWLTLGAVLVLTSCAITQTVPTDMVEFVTQPAGANIDIGMVGRCLSPCSLPLQRTHSYRVGVTRPGCEMAIVMIHGHVDPRTGRALPLTPNPVPIKLDCATTDAGKI